MQIYCFLSFRISIVFPNHYASQGSSQCLSASNAERPAPYLCLRKVSAFGLTNKAGVEVR